MALPRLAVLRCLPTSLPPSSPFCLPSLPFLPLLLQVVLPHPKQQEKDVVVFLDDALAAPTQEEAEQRGAVAALHRVQGDRALDRVLPRQYTQQWRDLEQQAS